MVDTCHLCRQTGLLSYRQFKLQALTSWIHTILFRKEKQKNGNKTYTLMKRQDVKDGGYFGWKWIIYAHLLMAQRHHDNRSKEFIQIIIPLTVWWATKGPQMVSQALWLKWPHHLQSDGAQRGHKWWARPCGWNDHTTYRLMGTKRPQMVSQALWLKWPHHLHPDGAQRGEPGHVVEMTTPLTSWWGTKRPQMVSQALWLKWPHHLHADGGQRGHKWWARLVVERTTSLTPWWGGKRPQMVSQASWLKGPHHLQTDGAQRGHKWWARPCGWNDHTTYTLMGDKEATNGEPGLWLKGPHHLHADGTQRGHKWWARPCGWNDHTTYSDFQNWFNVLHFLIVC